MSENTANKKVRAMRLEFALLAAVAVLALVGAAAIGVEPAASGLLF